MRQRIGLPNALHQKPSALADGCLLPITPEQWHKLGFVAGPIRNHRMILQGKPDGVIAFKGGNGTADMVRRSILCKVPVWDLREHLRA